MLYNNYNETNAAIILLVQTIVGMNIETTSQLSQFNTSIETGK